MQAASCAGEKPIHFSSTSPHRSDYTDILENASAGLSGDSHASRVRLRMGVYSDVDKAIDIERRFDRASLAADTVRSTFTKAIAIYDNKLHESEIFEEQLLESFQDALEQGQFSIYYQPKFNIRQDEPVLSSAEALVRWNHPELGMISPGIFIPIFEKNGLIQELDSHVWDRAAAQLHDWKERLGISATVSVNVSRVDMYDPNLPEKMQKLISRYGLTTDEFILEITESAYTQDSEQIVETVGRLRDAGFKVEMDDFGTGYSSLNMITTLPIDALKLDMNFIRNAFKERKDTRMLEVVIELAESLSVPTIAEGVETAEQMFTLREMGCDIVQGYYFSKPVPPEEYEKILIAGRQHDEKLKLQGTDGPDKDGRGHSHIRFHKAFTYNALHDPLTGLYNNSAFEMLLHDADKDHIGILIADIEDFAALKRYYSREITEEIVMNTAYTLRDNFRSVDYICRIKEEEFVVIMTRINSSIEELVQEKINIINEALLNPADDLPAVSLCVGMAFADEDHPVDSPAAIFNAADERLSQHHCGISVD